MQDPNKLTPERIAELREALRRRERADQHARSLERAQGRPKNRDRNKPCPCGSGRKYKRCCWG